MKPLASIVIVFSIGIFGCTFAQESVPSADEIVKKLNATGLRDIPGLHGLNASALPSVDDATRMLQRKCTKNGGPTAYAKADDARKELQECLLSLVNVTVLQSEIESAKPTGDLDTVFKKYCRKSPVLKGCVKNFTTMAEPCLEEKELELEKMIHNITESLLDFVCFKEGDRIALFIAAGGPECFTSKQSAVERCANVTLSGYVPSSDLSTGSSPSLESIPTFVLGLKECNDVAKLQTCIVKELETCKDPTPANIVDSMFTFIKKVTPCAKLLDEISEKGGSGSGSLANSAGILPMSILMMLSLRVI